MCGIVGAVAQRDVVEILLEGLRRLEYRGYDSAGVAVIQNGELKRIRSVGKVSELADKINKNPLPGSVGIAHTRWATHGKPSEVNAHPHVSGTIAIVHNGIIENYQELKDKLTSLGYHFVSDTDTEAMAHLINYNRRSSVSLLEAVQKTVKELRGAYGTAVIDSNDPDLMVVARCGSPLVIGIGIGENFVASDQLALLPVTNKFIFLEEGDIACITRRKVDIYDIDGKSAERKSVISDVENDAADKKGFTHFMLKEIYEQPEAIVKTIESRITKSHFIPEAFGVNARELFEKVEHIQIVACGTSYHAGLVSRYWMEEYAGISCNVEIASEYRYRKSVTHPNTLLVTLSQSGETADTLEALRLSKKQGYMASLAICNVSGSSLVRESDLCFMTRAGAEIGVASTKAFVTQLVALLLLVGSIGICKKTIDEKTEKMFISSIFSLPEKIKELLSMDRKISELAVRFQKKSSCLFLGRGIQWPIAMEGALKLKEISYIHAEAYAAGELKHGPIALIDENMPVIIVAPTNDLLEKLKSNIESVRARNGEIYIFADRLAGFENDKNCHIVTMPQMDDVISPVVYTVPLQLLAYHVAVLKGTDVDQPRNLAKSVTVE
jgi:glucosamine--fructose-6-phosphate aminotransferase (isomerizing)